jgi:ParB family chromosome partitioning protein
MDLSRLDSFGDTTADADGKPLQWPVRKLIPGNNPRTTFKEEALKSLAKSIAKRNVKSPISIHPVTPEIVAAWFEKHGEKAPDDLSGFAQINHGERRWRASIIAGKEFIPSHIDESHNGIDALAENVQRDDLDPMDIAVSLKEHVDAGMKQKAIAEELGYSESYVSNHLKLLALPEPVVALVRNAISTDVTALLQLGSAFKEYPEQVTEFCATTEGFTQAQVRAYIASLKNPQPVTNVPPQTDAQPQSSTASSGDGDAPSNAETNDSSDAAASSATQTDNGEASANADSDANNPVTQSKSDKAGSAEGKPRTPTAAGKVAGIAVQYEGGPVRLLLKVPSAVGRAWIMDEAGNEAEIDVGAIEQVMSVLVE